MTYCKQTAVRIIFGTRRRSKGCVRSCEGSWYSNTALHLMYPERHVRRLIVPEATWRKAHNLADAPTPLGEVVYQSISFYDIDG